MEEYTKVAAVINGKNKKNKLCYRLLTLCMGYAIAFAAGNFLMFNFDALLLFAVLMVVMMSVSKKLLRNMFLLERAWNMLIDKGYDLTGIIGRPYKTANMGKRLAFLGTLLGGFGGVVMVANNSGRENMYGEVFENVVLTGAVIIFTFWIPQLALLINKFAAKRFATKNPEMVASYAEALLAESNGDVATAKKLVKLNHVSGVSATRVATVLIVVSVIGNLYAIFDVKGTIKESIAEKEYAAQMEEEARLAEEAERDQAEAVQTMTNESEGQETEEEEEKVNPNGKGFYVTPECLEVYLNYISSGTAATDYNKWQNKRFEDWQRVSRQPTHFSICGMHSGEPYLLLGADFGGVSGDSILFAERSNNAPDSCSIVTDWDIMSYCDLSDRQFLIADKMYIYNGEKEKNAKFVLHRKMAYVETEYEDNMIDFLYYDTDSAGNLNHSKNEYNVERGVWVGELLEIKWFSINDIDAARAYYQQYATPEEDTSASTGPVYNRDDYYVPGSPLVYFDYIEGGQFTVRENAVEGYNPETYYEFSDLPQDFDWNKAVPHIDTPYIVRDGAAASDYCAYIFENEEGKLVCISVSELHDFEEGYLLIISYITNEESVATRYNNRYGTSCKTLRDIVDDMSGR